MDLRLIIKIFLRSAICLKIISFYLAFSLSAYSHQKNYSSKEIETALTIFEKAILLSPDFLSKNTNSSITPFYKVNGHKIYLNEAFWQLTKTWLKVYIEEVEKHCPCDLQPDVMIEEAKNYIPQNLIKKRMNHAITDLSYSISYHSVHFAATYGYAAAILKLSAEIAETILSVTVGGKGIHVLCNTIDVIILYFTRVFHKYFRVFSYGHKLKANTLILPLKVAWLSRKVHKSKKQVFFHIDQALVFRKQELAKINAEGPKSFFNTKGHRLLWLEQLKDKTQHLFDKISDLESTLQDSSLSNAKRKKIEKTIQKTKNKIENVSKLNRKDFFGFRYKRYLLLKSRKGQKAYMSGKSFPEKIIGKNILWPLSFQENILERVIKSSPSELNFNFHSDEIKADEIRDGLILEFLSKQNYKDSFFKDRQKILQTFLRDVEYIFDVDKPTGLRLMKVYSIETILAGFFAHYLKISGDVLSNKYHMSFSEKMKLQWEFGYFFRLIHEFSDFLATISVIQNKKTIRFYKYESMEKLLTFFDYLRELQNFLNTSDINKDLFFKKLKSKKDFIKSLSLLKRKNRSFRNSIQCKKLIEKDQ